MKKGVKITLWIIGILIVISIIGNLFGNDKPKSGSTVGNDRPRSGSTGSKLWTVGSFVDEFGDKTDNKFISCSKVIQGTYSNVAVKDEKLRVILIITKNSVGMDFYEDYLGIKTDVAHTFILIQPAVISVKDKDGETKRFNGTTPGISGQRLFISSYDDMINILKKGGTVQFSIREGDTSTYRFDIENADGFEEAYNQL
jgi:hypothetical protein